MAYVMLSRVQSISQLFILGSVPVSKFYAGPKALEELACLQIISLNRNPSRWEKEDNESFKVFSLNCQSLQTKIQHIRDDLMVTKSDAICLSETWLFTNDSSENLQIKGYKLHLNSFGHGKGLATYFKEDKFHHSEDISDEKFQITKLTSRTLDIISLYRSAESKLNRVEENLLKLIDLQKKTLICSLQMRVVFCICFEAERNNRLIKTLEVQGFHQWNTEATHIAGGHIGHLYVNNQAGADVSLYSPYYCAIVSWGVTNQQ